MPITWRATDDDRITIVFSNPYSIAESEKAMKEIFATPGLGRPFRFLVDVRQTVAPDVEFVTSAITFWQLHVREMWDAKIAVVAATDDQISMADMSEQSTAARELPFTLRVFRESEWEEAERWLAGARTA